MSVALAALPSASQQELAALVPAEEEIERTRVLAERTHPGAVEATQVGAPDATRARQRRRALTTFIVPGATAFGVLLIIASALTRKPPKPAPEPIPASQPATTIADAPKPPPTPKGRLTVHTRPWSTVTSDGHAGFCTPVQNHVLPVGRHRITFVSPEGQKRTVELVIRENETTTHFFSW